VRLVPREIAPDGVKGDSTRNKEPAMKNAAAGRRRPVVKAPDTRRNATMVKCATSARPRTISAFSGGNPAVRNPPGNPGPSQEQEEEGEERRAQDPHALEKGRARRPRVKGEEQDAPTQPPPQDQAPGPYGVRDDERQELGGGDHPRHEARDSGDGRKPSHEAFPSTAS
jgi:hypothetical protein